MVLRLLFILLYVVDKSQFLLIVEIYSDFLLFESDLWTVLVEPQHLYAVRSITACNTYISIADVMLLLLPLLHSFTPGMGFFGTVFEKISPIDFLDMSEIKVISYVHSTDNSCDLLEQDSPVSMFSESVQSPNCEYPIILKGGGPGN